MNLSIVHKFSLMTVLLVLFSVSTVGWVFYSKTSELLIDEALKDISVEIFSAGSRLQEHIKNQHEDVIFLANTPSIQGLLRALKNGGYDKQGKSTYQQWVRRQQSIFKTMLKSKPGYLKLRVIDKNGKELVVVGRENETTNALKESQLQNKAHRKYVSETLKLPVGKIYLSELNLNREHGKVSQPRREVLRSATPFFNEKTRMVAGLLLITAEVGHELSEIQNKLQSDSSSIYITNDRGDYLLHPDNKKSYGFDLGIHYLVQEEFPYLANY